jgi:hypothetical protein
MNAICFLFVIPDEITCKFASEINTHDIYFIIDDNNFSSQELKVKYPNINFIQIDDKICKNNGYINANSYWIPKTPTAWDKVFYYFCTLNKKYDNVWIIEEDVFIYNSDTFYNIDDKYKNYDLLVSSNNIKDENNKWLYWNLGENKIEEPQYHAMVCACRISKKLFECINNYVNTKKELFYIEIMINTIAMHNNLSINCPEELSTICPKPTNNRYRILNNKTKKLDWVTKDLPINIIKNFMYHPVKNIELHKIWRQ